MSDDMVLFTRTFDLLVWLLPKAESFPKLYRATLTHRLMNAALDFQEAIFEAQTQTGRERRARLRSADAHLNKLRLYLRLAHQMDWLNIGQYEHVCRMVAEVGRLLGGWIKQSSE